MVGHQPENPSGNLRGRESIHAFVPRGHIQESEWGNTWEQIRPWLRVSGLEIDPSVTGIVYAGSQWARLWWGTDAGDTWERMEGPLGRLSSVCLDVTRAPSRTFVYAGVVGGVIDLTATDGAQVARAAEGDRQFLGSGVYQFTIDHRDRTTLIYVPAVMRN